MKSTNNVVPSIKYKSLFKTPRYDEIPKLFESKSVFVIEGDGHRSVGLQIHKTTNEPYIVASQLDWIGGTYAESYFSIIKATYDMVKSESDVECTYEEALKRRLFSVYDERKIKIDSKFYRVMTYIFVEGIKIPTSRFCVGFQWIEVPTFLLPESRFKQYLAKNGMNEDVYHIPSELVEKVVRKLEEL